MNRRSVAPNVAPNVIIRVSGQLFQGHLPYLEQLVHSAVECGLRPLLNLSHLEELDRTALLYLIEGEDRDFGLVSCPGFIREWMEHEDGRAAA